MRTMKLTLSLAWAALSLAPGAHATSLGILNASGLVVSSLHATIAASTPGASVAGPTPVVTATAVATPVLVPVQTQLPGVVVQPAPNTANQLFWANGVTGTPWSYNLTLVYNGSGGTAAVTDTVNGDGTVLQVSSNGSATYAFIEFYLAPLPLPPLPAQGMDITAYYPSGHLQFDVELGPASDVANTTMTIGYGGVVSGACRSTAIPGLSATSFTHVSVPMTSGFPACNVTGNFAMIGISATDGSGGNMAPGIQFYLNNVQLTSN
jgi:hypothetical protein